jgi:hypothetical protein
MPCRLHKYPEKQPGVELEEYFRKQMQDLSLECGLLRAFQTAAN